MDEEEKPSTSQLSEETENHKPGCETINLERFKNIKNKELRRNLMAKHLRLKKKLKKQEKARKRSEGIPKQVPHTIESLREKDITLVNNEDEEELAELQNNDYTSYFQKSYEPRVLITCSDNPLRRTRIFAKELGRIIPNSLVKSRNRSGVKKMVESCKREGFTDIVIVNENMSKPNGLLIVHLPDGPTAYFRLSNVKLTPELKRSHKEITSHRPEVILNNFVTKLGQSVAFMLAALFHYDPEFKGRRAVTFHNQRDYIFFRHHRYEFKSAKKVGLRELGPRFTLRLQYIQKGTFDTKLGEYEWTKEGRRHDLETSRRKFFL